jgi:hypothetical protein
VAAVCLVMTVGAIADPEFDGDSRGPPTDTTMSESTQRAGNVGKKVPMG